MGYVGTTAASSISNPPVLIGRAAGGTILGSTLSGTGLWLYQTSDATTVMISTTYFTDGFYLGMRQADIVYGYAGATVGSSSGNVFVGAVGAVTTAGCGLVTTAGVLSSTR